MSESMNEPETVLTLVKPDMQSTMTVREAQNLINQKMADRRYRAAEAEEHLFQLRDTIEVLWIEIGAVMADIIDQKYYKYRQDEDGNYFRTAKGYFEYLDKRFVERGWNLSRSTLYRFADDYRLFVKTLGFSEQDCVTLGKSTLQRLAPGVRRLVEDGKPDEARQMTQEVLTAIETVGGLPPSEVDIAVDDATGRIMKSLAIEFSPTAFGYKVKKLTLWWGGMAYDVAHTVFTEEQAAWLAKRLGNKFGEERD